MNHHNSTEAVAPLHEAVVWEDDPNVTFDVLHRASDDWNAVGVSSKADEYTLRKRQGGDAKGN